MTDLMNGTGTGQAKKRTARRTWAGVATLAVAAGTLGVATVVPDRGGSPQKAAAVRGATETARATESAGAAGQSNAEGIVTKAGTGTKVFTFRTTAVGDCRRMNGATWKLSSTGHAYFKGHFWSSSGDDAWLMYAKLLDHRGGLIGYLRADRNPGDARKFVIGLPEANQIYTAGRNAYFTPRLFDEVTTISLTRHC
ncbi:DUF6294 family protein [Streptomyces indicus]|uniref:DUF6294 domain-containing protein n=1 Tax=Streptomyces indicus TaxID=417292 RepID=A0A1G9HDY8_9ACTN|nr:DUF6294 family protein [Streptomyces indicus]SDL11109.1 hypothetical protein SAMN05421806_118142 [Streptomyces indicus]